jgi:mono/diheme cytochrome c family protein
VRYPLLRRFARDGLKKDRSMTPRLRLALGISLLVALGAPLAPVVAQDTLPKVSITPAQVDRGRTEYRRSCLDCHGEGLDDGEFGGAPLKGLSFREKWFGMTADVLYGYLSSAMPPDRPGRLSPQVYADLTAYILSANGVQPGASELPADLDALAGLMIE